MSAAATKFTITYSRNWDGGKQEYRTALQAVNNVFPQSKVVEDCVDKYPIRVIVTAQVEQEETTTKEIWSGRQQDLFSKYAAKRKKAIRQIESSLEDLKKEFDLKE